VLLGPQKVPATQQIWPPFGPGQTRPLGQHTPLTQVEPEGQQTSPLGERQGSVTTFVLGSTQRHLFSTQVWPAGQQMPKHGGLAVFSQRQTPSRHSVPGWQQKVTVAPVEVVRVQS